MRSTRRRTKKSYERRHKFEYAASQALGITPSSMAVDQRLDAMNIEVAASEIPEGADVDEDEEAPIPKEIDDKTGSTE